MYSYVNIYTHIYIHIYTYVLIDTYTHNPYPGAIFLYVDGLLMFSTIMAKGMAIGDGGFFKFVGQDHLNHLRDVT